MNIKDVHNAIRDIEIQGGHKEDIEAFIINEDDYHDLLEAFDNKPYGSVFDNDFSPYNMKLLGVRLIVSPYMESGTIFKVMKNDQKRYANPTDETGNFVIPNQPYSPKIVGFLPTTGLKNFGATAGEATESVKELAKAMGIPSHLLNDEVDEGTETPEVEPEEEKTVEDRHSKTRKIKLD